MWTINEISVHDLSGSMLIVGLPGIGNVGKIASDFLVEQLKAKKICEFFSFHMPNAVFVTEDNLVALPKIELHLYNKGSQKLLIMTGDTQPADEIGTYGLCSAMLDFLERNKCSGIITMGGIGLSEAPKVPKVYLTGSSKDAVGEFSGDTKLRTEVYGVVGPVIGVSGLLVGLAGTRKMKAVSLLAETLGHPMYMGFKGAREILKVLSQKLDLDIDLKNLEKEIKEIESKLKMTENIGKPRKEDRGDMSYIG